MPICDPQLENRFKTIARLPSWETRVAVCRDILGARSSEEGCAAIEALFTANQTTGSFADATMVVAMWAARFDAETTREASRLRPRPRDEVLEGLQAVAPAFPLTGSMLAPDVQVPRRHARPRDGTIVDPLMLRSPYPPMDWKYRRCWRDDEDIPPEEDCIERHLAHGCLSRPVAMYLERRITLRGETMPLQIAEILHPAKVTPRVLVALAAVTPLPPVLVSELVLRWSCLAQPSLRTALALNRTAPARLVTALVPIARAPVLRALAAGRHPDPAVARCARAFIRARPEANRAVDARCPLDT